MTVRRKWQTDEAQRNSSSRPPATRVGVADHVVAPGDQLAGALQWNVQQTRKGMDRKVGADPLTKSNSGSGSAVSAVCLQLVKEILVVLHQAVRAELASD